mgnify:CR=1 FL=1
MADGTYRNSMSQGTNDLPAQSMMRRNAAMMGKPRTTKRIHVLIWSTTQSFLVDLLNPCRSSSTNVL